jgi:hypothetical protein
MPSTTKHTKHTKNFNAKALTRIVANLMAGRASATLKGNGLERLGKPQKEFAKGEGP